MIPAEYSFMLSPLIAALVGFVFGGATALLLWRRPGKANEGSSTEERARRVLRYLYKHPSASEAVIRKVLLRAGLPTELMTIARRKTEVKGLTAFFEEVACVVDKHTILRLFETQGREYVRDELLRWYEIGALPLEAAWRIDRMDQIRTFYAQTTD